MTEHFIWSLSNVITPLECREFIQWAEQIPRDAESPQPVIRVVEGGPHRSPGEVKVESALRQYANFLGVDVFDGPAKLQVLHYREGNSIPWHPDYRPNEVNFKVSVSVCLRPGSHVFEYVSSSGVATFAGHPGDAVFFPSWVSHRVVPAEGHGDRWALAAWLRGPEYK